MASSIWDTTESRTSDSQNIYHDLHPGEIRLIKLLSGQWLDEIRCQLSHASLANLPSYKALSYAWGSPRATRPIVLNGYQWQVTANLESALRRLRRSDTDLIIWIDALCINQLNIPERTNQVRIMHNIFAHTEEVIAYLGEAPSHGPTVTNEQVPTSNKIFNFDDTDEDKLDIFRKCCIAKGRSKVLSGETTKDYAFDVLCFLRLLSKAFGSNYPPMFDYNSGQFIDSKYQQNIFEGLRLLMFCRWWNRIWVIQEIVVPKTVTIVYGSTVAPWSMFVAAADWQSRNLYSPAPLSFPHEYATVLTHFSLKILDIERMRQSWRDREQQPSLLPLLRQFSGRKASDDRDKVFALLSLARDQTSIVPDYSLSVPAVFKAAVIDILKNTKSLAVLAGDLGRKDRQDLPSWVPDWSATYYDLDRRRADNTEKYCSTNGCQVYVQDVGDGKMSAIREYLKIFKGPSNESTIQQNQDFLTEVLGTSEWIKFLPDEIEDKKWLSHTYLNAINRFYIASGRAVCLRIHRDGIIGIPGLAVDTVAITGRTAISDDEVLEIVNSWALLVVNYFREKSYDRTGIGLGDAFRRTLCADIINSTRGLEKEDHGRIASWFFQDVSNSDLNMIFKNESPLNNSIEGSLWRLLFKDIEELDIKNLSSLTIDASIRSATLRRTFFITKKGYIGLGPANMQPDDSLYILMGGHTPFILRQSNSRKLSRFSQYLGDICFEVIGDCYTHGLMDGEIMDEWRSAFQNIKDDFPHASWLKSYKENFEEYDRCRNRLSALRRGTDEVLKITKAGDGNPQITEFDQARLENTLSDWVGSVHRRVKRNESSSQEQPELRNLITSEWKSEMSRCLDHFQSQGDISRLTNLINVVTAIVDSLSTSLWTAEDEMEGLKQKIRGEEADAPKTNVYLV